MQHEIAGEGDDQQQLGHLARLEAERAEVDPDARAVDGGAEPGHHRQQQQDDRGQPARVGEPLEDPVVAQRHQGDHEEADPEGHPDQLLAGEGVVERQVETVDDGQAEAVEGGHDREQHRVGVRRGEADRDVGGHDQRGQPAAVAHDVGRHLALHAEADGGVGADADREREHEQEQLGTPATAVHELHEDSGLGHRSAARSRGRRHGRAGRRAGRGARGRETPSRSGRHRPRRRRGSGWPRGGATARWASARLSASMPSRTVEAS